MSDRVAGSQKEKKQVILHPILCAVYPVVFLYTANKNLFDLPVIVVPALVLAAMAGALWALLTKLLGNRKLAAVYTSVPVLAFFSYSAVQTAVGAGNDRAWAILIAVCLVVACAAAAALWKWREGVEKASYVLNLVSLVLVAAPAFQAVMWHVSTYSARALLPAADERAQLAESLKPKADLPDIYYFVLDGYGREDVLRTDYDFDNSAFTTALEDRGFYVAEEAESNYPFTLLSIASTLNGDYLEKITGENLGAFPGRVFLREALEDNEAVRLLRSAGYKIVSYPSDYNEVTCSFSDVLLRQWWSPGEFAVGLFIMTPVPAVLESLGWKVFFDLHRSRTLYPLDHMEDALAIEGPKLVFVHSYFGHPPFVLDAEGNPVNDNWGYTWDDGSRLLGEDDTRLQGYLKGYRDQISYLNGRLLETIDQIVEGSDQPPVIVMHGDHGPGSKYSTLSLENTDVRERYGILYAALLPEKGREQMYPSITPVNSFRMIFNSVFDANLPLLADKRYFAPFDTPYAYQALDDAELTESR